MDRRTPMAAGITFAVLYAIALLAVPPLPGIDKPGYAIVAHVDDHASAMRAQALLVAFAALSLVVVIGYARQRLTGPPARVFVVGGAAIVVQLVVWTWFTAGLALHPDQLGSATARTIGDVMAMMWPLRTITDLMVAVPILMAANEDRFPRWMGTAAAVFAVEQLIETITIIGPPGSFISPGGSMNYWLGAPLFVLFFLALGVALVPPGTDTGAEDPSPGTDTDDTDSPDTGTSAAEDADDENATAETDAIDIPRDDTEEATSEND